MSVRAATSHYDKLERDHGIAHRLYALAGPNPRDVFVTASQSGINGCVVALTQHTARVSPQAPSGRCLADPNRPRTRQTQLPVHAGPCGDEHNLTLDSRYVDRSRRTA